METAAGLNMTTAGTATGTGISVTKIRTVTAADSNTTGGPVRIDVRNFGCCSVSTLVVCGRKGVALSVLF